MGDSEKKRWVIELDEGQLRLIAECVEDCHRFAAGQCDMSNMILRFSNRRDIKELLRGCEDKISTCDWAGNGAVDDAQRGYVARTYGIYREILHQICLSMGDRDGWSVYEYPTLRCEEQGELPIVKLIDKDK